MKIRNAAEKDIPGIAALSRRFTEEVPTWGQVAITEGQIRQFDKRLIWVVEDENRLVGYAIWQPHKKDASCIFKKNDKILRLDEIYLVPEARGKGIGSQLLRRINDYAGQAGYTKLFVYSSVKDLDPIIEFYRGNGFKTWAVQLFKEIGKNVKDSLETKISSIAVRLLEAQDIPRITSIPSFLNINASASYFERLMTEQIKGERTVFVARSGDMIAGFVTIKWQADYPPFAERGIPEINDLRVLAEFRRCGIATALMDEAEKRIFEKSPVAGIGVGLYADYGPAQRMYILRGYVPDGHGVSYKSQPVSPGHDIFVDDNLLLYFTKERQL